MNQSNEQNWDLKQGCSFRKKLIFKDDQSTPQPIDLTDYQLRGKMRIKTGDVSSVADFDFTILNQSTNKGEVIWELSAIKSALLPCKSVSIFKNFTFFLYDIELVDPSGAVKCIMQGQFNVTSEVTK